LLNDLNVDDENYSRTENNQGGFRNGSFAAQGDGSYYYINPNDGYKLYKADSNNTARKKLSDKKCDRLLVSGEYIYYISSRYLYRVKNNGTDNLQISSNIIYNFTIDNGYIYYINSSDKSKLYRMTLEGRDNTRLSDNMVDSSETGIVVNNGWVFYLCKNYIYKVKTDGTSETQLNNYLVDDFSISDDWIYCIETGTKCLYKVRTDGKMITDLKLTDVERFVISGDWMYYTDGNLLYKLKLYSPNKIRLDKDNRYQIDEINIAGEWIYWHVSNQSINRYYRIKRDGTNKEIIY
jgi:hypothetical protein